jgi:hypothetical protein
MEFERVERTVQLEAQEAGQSECEPEAERV